jgi:hypothetical protein
MTAPSIRAEGLPRLLSFFWQHAALGRVLEWRLASPVVCKQPVADLVEILGQDPQADVQKWAPNVGQTDK